MSVLNQSTETGEDIGLQLMSDNSTDLERAYSALNGKLAGYNEYWEYYRNQQSLVYSSERLAEIFGSDLATFHLNWCKVVVGSVFNRLRLRGWGTGDKGANALLDELWSALGMSIDADDVHEAALVCGEAFLIVWPDDEGNPAPYFNDPRLCHMFYDGENPRKKEFAAKWWVGGDGRRYMTLYYPDQLEYYVSKGKAEAVTSAQSFEPCEEPAAKNPTAEIPVFHFRRTTNMASELEPAKPVQDAIDKLLADMMVAAEYGAFAQRYVITNADISKLKNGPNQVWELPAGDGVGQSTSAGQFSQTDLGGFLDSIRELASSLATITDTPKHYLVSSGASASGEALHAMEAPLIAKLRRIMSRFGVTWREVAAFMLKLSRRPIPAAQIVPIWDDPRTVQPVTESQARQASVNAGIPLVTQLRREGWTDDELRQLDKDRAAESKAKANLAQAYLEQARLQFDQERDGDDENGE